MYNNSKLLRGLMVNALLCAGFIGNGFAVTGKSFFMPRSVGQDAVLEQATLHHFIHANKPSPRFTLDVAAFYQESTNSGGLSNYFMPNNKTSLSIKGATAADHGTADISALWLLIAGTNSPANPVVPIVNPGVAGGFPDVDSAALYLNEYSSTISMKPEYRTFGASLSFYKAFECTHNRIWFSLFMPVSQMETNVKLNEYNVTNNVEARSDIAPFDVQNSGVTPLDVRLERATLGNNLSAVEAFNSPLWKFGKIKNGVQKITGLADVKMKLGWRFVDGKFVHCDIYPSVIIPTGYKPKAEYMFEPIVGNAQHVGFGGGTTINFAFVKEAKSYVGLGSNVEYHYMFRGTERRSFDLLANGAWSRYLLVYEPTADPFTVKPGINFFTKDVKVTPQSELNWLTSFNGRFHSFFFETGYNLWWKDREKVALKNAWTEEIAIARLFSDITTGAPFNIASASTARISQSSF